LNRSIFLSVIELDAIDLETAVAMNSLQRRIMSSVAMHHACNDASVVALPTVFPLLYSEGLLIKRYSDIGTMILAGLVFAIVAQFFIGHGAKRRHARRFLALDTLIVGISLTLMTLSKNYMMLLLFFIGVRIGTSIYHPVGISWISHTFKGRDLDRAMGFQSAFGNLGVLAAFASTGFVAELFGWKAPLMILGMFNFLVLILAFSISRGTEGPRMDDEDKERVSWRDTFRGLKLFIPPIALGGIAWGITLGYAPSLLNHKLSVPMSRTGIILGCWMGAGALSTMSYGRISAILGRPRTLLISYVTMVVTSLVLCFSTNLPLTVTAFILYGVALFVTFPAILSFVGSSIERRNRTAAFSVTSNMQIVGNSLFVFIGGFLSDRFGINIPFLLLGCVTFIVLIYMTVIIRAGRCPTPLAPPPAKPKDIVAG